MASTQPASLFNSYAPQEHDTAAVANLLKLQRATKAISSTLDLGALIDTIVDEVSQSFCCVDVEIYLRDDERDLMVLHHGQRCVEGQPEFALKIGRDGMVGHVARTGMPRYAPDVNLDPYYVPCSADIKSAVAIPLIVDEKIIGVFNAVHSDAYAFSEEQLQVLKALSEHIGIAVYNARLFQKEQQRSERLSKDAEDARRIQQELLPKSSLFLDGVTVTGATLPAGAVGGDWYDFFELPDGRWAVVLADVSGKGMAAALLMSATRSIFRSIAATASSPGDALQKLNSVLIRDFPDGRFVTMVYGVLDVKGRTLTFANAGHLWPLVSHPHCAEYVETRTGLPLGLTESTFSDSLVRLNPGTRVLFYSDGIVEADNVAGEEYGQLRLTAAVQRSASPREVLDEVREFTGAVLADDATALLIAAR